MNEWMNYSDNSLGLYPTSNARGCCRRTNGATASNSFMSELKTADYNGQPGLRFSANFCDHIKTFRYKQKSKFHED